MFCKYCGSNLEENTNFCPHCGKSLENTNNTSLVYIEHTEKQENKLTCPRCGSSNIHFVTIQGGQDFDKSDACCGYLLCGPLGLLCGVKDKQPTKTVRKCMNCNFEF